MHILLYYSFTSPGIPSINLFAYWFLAVSLCVLIIWPVWFQNQKILTIPSMWVLNVHTDLNLEDSAWCLFTRSSYSPYFEVLIAVTNFSFLTVSPLLLNYC